MVALGGGDEVVDNAALLGGQRIGQRRLIAQTFIQAFVGRKAWRGANENLAFAPQGSIEQTDGTCAGISRWLPVAGFFIGQGHQIRRDVNCVGADFHDKVIENAIDTFALDVFRQNSNARKSIGAHDVRPPCKLIVMFIAAPTVTLERTIPNSTDANGDRNSHGLSFKHHRVHVRFAHNHAQHDWTTDQ